MSKRKSIIILIIAILCGLLGVFLVMNYVGDIQTVYSEKTLNQVVTAMQDIPKDVRITREMLKMADIQSEYILPKAFTRVEDVVGAMTTTGIFKGEQILQVRISRGDKPGEFAYRIPEGRRAIAVAIDPVKGVSGFIQPGNRVDVLGTFEVPCDNSGSATGEATATDGTKTVNVTVKVSWMEELKVFQKIAQKLLEGRRIVTFDGGNITFLLLQNIEVLAVGDKISASKQDAGVLPVNGKEEAKEAKTIVLCLDPEQAELITNMEKVGTLKLDLRNPADDRIVETKPIVEYKPK